MMLSWLVVVAIYRVIDSALNTLGSLGVRPLLLLRDGIRSFNSTDSLSSKRFIQRANACLDEILCLKVRFDPP
jgi:hypothetical protein